VKAAAMTVISCQDGQKMPRMEKFLRKTACQGSQASRLTVYFPFPAILCRRWCGIVVCANMLGVPVWLAEFSEIVGCFAR
jgi:hypothetical protein